MGNGNQDNATHGLASTRAASQNGTRGRFRTMLGQNGDNADISISKTRESKDDQCPGRLKAAPGHLWKAITITFTFKAE